MAQYGEDYGKQTDEYGNPIHRSEEAGGEEYGSTGKTGQYGVTGGGYGTEKYGTTGAHPTGQHGETGGGYGTEQYGNTGATGGGYGTEQYGNTGATGGGYGTDQYGNTGATGGGYGTEKYGTTGAHPTGQHGGGIGLGTTDAGVTGGGHRRSGSSSSEDDGQGGRRKKGLKDKIKEKLPGGGHKDDEYQSQYDPTATTGGAGEYDGGAGEYGGGAEHEKKGFMEKIKDKLPGGGR